MTGLPGGLTPTTPPPTNQEALEALLIQFGVIARTSTSTAGGEVKLVAGVGGVEGYRGFHARFRFNSAGKFTDVGIWE